MAVKRKNDLTRRNALVDEYQGYVRAVVRRMMVSMKLPKDLYDEFVAAGNLGLVEAASRYKENKGVEFKRYAFLRIRGSVIDNIRNNSENSSRAYRYARALQAAHELREDEITQSDLQTKKEPLTKKEREVALAKLLHRAAKSAMAFRLSAIEAEREITELGEDGNTETTMVKVEDSDLFIKLIKTLPKKERFVVENYYFKNKSFVDMARKQRAHSKSWISRLHTRAIEMLKERYEEVQRGDVACPLPPLRDRDLTHGM